MFDLAENLRDIVRVSDHSPTHFRNPKILLKKTGNFTTEIVNKEDFVGPNTFYHPKRFVFCLVEEIFIYFRDFFYDLEMIARDSPAFFRAIGQLYVCGIQNDLRVYPQARNFETF